MPTLVLGAENPLGIALVTALAAGGGSVRGFVDERRPEAAEVLRARRVPVAVGDPEEVDFVAAAAAGVDTVILVSEPYAGADDATVAGTAARLARLRSITRVIYLSSVDADEASPHVYLADRGRAETLLQAAAEEKVVVARVNVVVGSVLEARWRTRFPIVPGDGTQVWRPVGADRVVEALCQLDDLAAPDPVRYIEGVAARADAAVGAVAPRPHLLRHDPDGSRVLRDRLGTHLAGDMIGAG